MLLRLFALLFYLKTLLPLYFSIKRLYLYNFLKNTFADALTADKKSLMVFYDI
jgi:hypothetical protein